MKKNLLTFVLALLLVFFVGREAVKAAYTGGETVSLPPLQVAPATDPYIGRTESYTGGKLQGTTELYRDDKGAVLYRVLNSKGEAIEARAASPQEVSIFLFGEAEQGKMEAKARIKDFSSWLSSTSKDWSRLTAVQKDTALKVLVDGMADLATVVEGR